MINEENGLPIPPKKESTGLPIPPLKKKVATEPTQSTEQLPSNAPSVSAGGSSGLEAGGSEQPKSNTTNLGVDNSKLKGIDFESARTYKKPIKTELGGSAYAYVKPNKDFTIEDERNNNKILKDATNKTQIDDYDKYKVKKSTEQATLGKKPFAQDDTQNTIDYYFDYLKRNDPEQYEYVISRQKSLSEDKTAHLASGATEDVEEDDLMLQKVNADLIREAFKLKANVFASKKEQASNLVKNNYSDILSKVNDGSKRSDDIDNRVNQIQSTINEMYSDDEGRIMMTPYNKDDIQNLFKERDSLLEEQNGLKKELSESVNDEKFTSAMGVLDDVEKSYNSIAETYNKIKSNDPSVFKGFDEYKKQLNKKENAQDLKDLTGGLTGEDFGIVEAVSQSLTKIPKTLAYITKGSDSEYGLNDWLYDVVASNTEDFHDENIPLPTGFNEEVYKDGKWNLKYLPGKLAGTIADMAPEIAVTMATEGASAGLLAKLGTSGELGTYMGSFAGEYITQVSDYYDEATKAGLSNKDAVTWARGMATTQAAIGSISPDVNLARLSKGGLDEVVMAISKKQSPKDAIKKTLGKIANNAAKEVPQEITQTLKEISDKNEMYRDIGLSEKIVEDIKSVVIETAIVSLAVSFIMGEGSFESAPSMNKQALYMAANQPDVVIARAAEMLKNKQMTQEQYDKFETVMQKASVAVSKLSKDLDAEKKVEIVPIIMEKEDLKEQKTNTDESQHEAINEKIKQKDEEIKSVLEAPSEEQVEYENLVNDFLIDFDKSQSEDTEQEIEQPQENAAEQVVSDIQAEKDGIKLDESLTDTQKSEKEMGLSQAELELKQNEPVELTEQKPVNKEEVVPLNDKANKDETVDAVEETPSENKTELYSLVNLIPTTELRRPNGSIGTQGFTEENLISVARHIANDMGFEIPDYDKSLKSSEVKQLIDFLKSNEELKQKIKDYVAKDPVVVSFLPDETYHVEDGNHRANLLNLIGINEIPTIELNGKEKQEAINEHDEKVKKITKKDLAKTKKTNSSESVIPNELPKEKASENKTETQSPEPNKEELTQEYIDKQEQLEESVSNDKDIEAKMEDDIKVLQSFSIANEKHKGKTQQEIEKLATTKYQGAITRAYKAFLDGKIKRSTYTDFRNRLEEVLGPKVAEKGRDTNGKIDAIRDKVKEVLLGEGYKQKQLYAFTSAVPLTPKNVEQLIDLTFDVIKKGVAAGKEVKSLTKFVLDNASKKIKNYSAILEAEGFTDEDFRNAFDKRINEFDKSEKYEAKVESDKKEPVDTEKQNNENQPSNEDGTSQSNKETVDNGSNEQNDTTENTSQSNKKEGFKQETPDVTTGKKTIRKHFERLSENKNFQAVLKQMKTITGYKDVVSIEKVKKAAESLVNDYYIAGELENFAIELLKSENKEMIDDNVRGAVFIKVAQKLNDMSQEKKLSDFERDSLEKLSAEVTKVSMDEITQDARNTKVNGEILKDALSELSANSKVMEDNVKSRIREIQENSISESDKQKIKELTNALNQIILENEKLKSEIENNEKPKSSNADKKRTNKKSFNKANFDNFMDSLKTDLTDC